MSHRGVVHALVVGALLRRRRRPTPTEVARRMRVDPGWRRIEDGGAARLGIRQTIDVARPVGRWRGVDPRRPQDRWRSAGRVLGLGLWSGAVGVAWWMGSSRGRGPLAGVRELEHLGAAISGSGGERVEDLPGSPLP